MINNIDVQTLEIFAARIRLETLKMFGSLGFGHIGGAMSVIELLAVLYGNILNIKPDDPDWPERDRLVMSKGHAGPSLYSTLALKGYFPMEMLKTLNKPGTKLPSHCDKNLTIGIDMTTGSLGQGMSTAIGMAMGLKLDSSKSRVYLIIGDGECDEGQIWEGALFAAHYKLENLTAFVDANGKQLDGYTKDIMNLGDIGKKFEQFGWYIQSIDGHNIEEINDAVIKANDIKGKPSMIVLNTLKGKGCTFAENELYNHHMVFNDEKINEAIDCVKNVLKDLMENQEEIK